MSNSIAGVQIFIRYLEYSGLRNCVVSPGSRNAPVILSVSDANINCHLNQDERSAAFMALGMSMVSGKPTVLSCTSGTAILNYIPGILEARYQNIPLIILTADRPPELIEQADGQAINQLKALQNICEFQYTLPSGINNEDDLYKFHQLAQKAWENAIVHSTPVHVNIPLREPLYKGNLKAPVRRFRQSTKSIGDAWSLDEKIEKRLYNNPNILIICGQRSPLSTQINTKKIVGEYLSNIDTSENVLHSELILQNEKSAEELQPDILITFGGPILSKKTKTWLRGLPKLEHWHLSESGKAVDTFGKLSAIIKVTEDSLNTCIQTLQKAGNENYRNLWLQKEQNIIDKIATYHQQNISEALVAQVVIKNASENANIFFGNSMSVRYSQYVETSRLDLTYFANRGVSGIDGINSTALGIATCSEKQTILINGDVSFVHDINALWLNPWPSNFKIVVINNQGGGIFRFIDGPTKNKPSFKYFEGENNVSIKDLCNAYKKLYATINSDEIRSDLPNLLKSKTQIIEIKFSKNQSIDEVKSMINELKK